MQAAQGDGAVRYPARPSDATALAPYYYCPALLREWITALRMAAQRELPPGFRRNLDGSGLGSVFGKATRLQC